MKKIAVIGIMMLMFPNNAMSSYDITLTPDYSPWYDSDYVFLDNGTNAFVCGTGGAKPSSFNITTVEDGQTVWVGNGSYLLLCCADLGYWVNFGFTYELPSAPTCAARYNWRSLGNHKYCKATQSSTYNWCDAAAQASTSGIIMKDDLGDGCTYTDSTCSTMTHCDTGYYKNGTTCTACPNSGTTSGYTGGGIGDCYLPIGTTGADASGQWQIVNGNCAY